MNKLVNYSSSSSSDEEVSEPVIKKIKRLPMPFAKSIDHQTDDGSLNHQGRKRQIPHQEGNWASHIHIDCEQIKNDLKYFTAEVESNFPEIKCVENPHVSLSKTFILKFHWIENFSKVLQNNIKYESFYLVFSLNVIFLSNEDKSRHFACILVNEDCQSFLEPLINQVNKSLKEFELPNYYDNFILHASFLWKLKEFTEDEKNFITSGIQNFLKSDTCNIFVDKITFKTGNKVKYINSS